MLNPKELWIGDRVVIISVNQQGIFEGISTSGKARIKLSAKEFVEAEFVDLVIHEETGIPPVQHKGPDQLKPILAIHEPKHNVPFTTHLDLHFEKLSEKNKKELHESILEFQLRILTAFIRYHISKKSGTIHIVHGKGEGILKKEVEALLHSFSEVSLVVPRMDKGSMDVWLGAVR